MTIPDPPTFSTARTTAGIAGGVLLIATALMHSLAGWPSVRRTFLASNVEPDIVTGLAVPWHLAAVGLAAFGLLAIMSVITARQEPYAAIRTLRVIGGALLLFGVAGLVFIRVDGTFALFIAPALMLLFASR